MLLAIASVKSIFRKAWMAGASWKKSSSSLKNWSVRGIGVHVMPLSVSSSEDVLMAGVSAMVVGLMVASKTSVTSQPSRVELT